jgi:hypothetical protein
MRGGTDSCFVRSGLFDVNKLSKATSIFSAANTFCANKKKTTMLKLFTAHKKEPGTQQTFLRGFFKICIIFLYL